MAARWTTSLALAAVNGESLCVVSGPEDAVARFEQRLAAEDVACQRLHTSHAFHSAMTEPILDEFEALVRRAEPVSRSGRTSPNLTGTWVTDGDAADPHSWALHLRRTVRFGDGLATILADGPLALVEVGPGARWAASPSGTRAAVPSTSSSRCCRVPTRTRTPSSRRSPASAGCGRPARSVDWRACTRTAAVASRCRRTRSSGSATGSTTTARLPSSWRTAQPQRPRHAAWAPVLGAGVGARVRAGSVTTNGARQRWLAFLGADPFGTAVAERLADAGHTVVTVRAGDGFSGDPERGFVLDPASAGDLDRLLQTLVVGGLTPDRILHALALEPVDPSVPRATRFEKAERVGLRSVLELAAALSRNRLTHAIELTALTNGVHEVTGREPLAPERSMIARRVPHDRPGVPHASGRARSTSSSRARMRLRTTGWHARSPSTSPTRARASTSHIARAGGSPSRQHAVRLAAPASVADPARGGTYLVTGGLGKLGLVLAGFLAEQAEAQLVLVGRSPFPDRAQWDEWLDEHDDVTAERIRAVRALENARSVGPRRDGRRGRRRTSMRRVIDATHERFGPIHGVVHAAGDMSADVLLRDRPGQRREDRAESRAEGARADGAATAPARRPGRALAARLVDLDDPRRARVRGLCGRQRVPRGVRAGAAAAIDGALAEHRVGRVPSSTGEHGPSEALGPNDVTDALARVLAQPRPKVAVSVTDLNQRIRRWVTPPQAPEAAPRRPRP